jgi:hypothetical protein
MKVPEVFFKKYCDPFYACSFFFLGLSETESTWYVDHYWSIVQPRIIDVDECGVVGRMRIGMG